MLTFARFSPEAIQWTLCTCGGRDLHKLQRRWWMRAFFPHRRLYQCGSCKARVFLSLLR